MLKTDTQKINKSFKFCHTRLTQKVLPLKIRNASLALRIVALFEVMSSRGKSSMLSIEWTGRVKWSETVVGWSMCCCVNGFFDRASVLTKYVAEIDCEPSLFFLQLVTCVRERRAAKPRDARNEGGSPRREKRDFFRAFPVSRLQSRARVHSRAFCSTH